MNLQLRPVQVMRFRKNPETGMSDYVPAEVGRFHAWGCEYQEFEAGPGNYSVAIVEFADGSVQTFLPFRIRFLDGANR